MPKHAKLGLQNNKLKFVCAAIVFIFAALACFATQAPQTARAANTEVIAYSVDAQGKQTNYYSIDEAIRAGYSDEKIVIVMACDWIASSTIDIADSKSVTIDMNGHKITNKCSNNTFRLYENAHLTLMSSKKTTFLYAAWNAADGSLYENETIETGGLVTGANTSDEGGAIWAENWTTLTLDNVAIAGNQARNGGGVRIDKEAKLYMKNGASIQGNKSSGDAENGKGGGVYVYQNDTNIYMENSSISHNYATGGGGGIYAKSDATRISMTKNSSIDYNNASTAGGGIYFYYTYCNVISSDKTASISYNNTRDNGSGGGIFFSEVRLATNEGEVSGVKLKGNTAEGRGGGLYINQKSVRVSDCTIDNNKCDYWYGGGVYIKKSDVGFYNCTITNNNSLKDGGGLYVEGDTTIENCTITGNSISTGNGGGAFVDSFSDITLKGKVVVKDNTRTNGAADDLFLEDGIASTAYIKGSVDADSEIGIRTSASGNRLLAKQVSTYVEGTYFMDLEGFYISHGTDHDGDLWQRKGASRWAVRLNSKIVGSYNAGATVALNGATTDSDKVFWRWSEEKSSGLEPFSDYVGNITKQTLTFSMPKKNVNLVADYVEYAKDIQVEVARPVAGKTLPLSATLKYTSGGETKSLTVDGIRWLDSAGKQATTAAYGEKYRFYFVMSDEKDIGFAFPSTLEASDVSLVCTDGGSTPGIQDAHVEGTSYLNVTTNYFETGAPAIESVEGASFTVTAGTTEADLKALLPSVARAKVQGGTSVELATDTSSLSWPSGLIVGGVVSNPAGESAQYTVNVSLQNSDKVASTEGKFCAVTITVVPKEKVVDPVVSPISGTYTKYSDVMRLEDGNKLTVKATCATQGATIKYKINGEGPKDYDANAGIVLTCLEDNSASYKLVFWAEKTNGEKSEEVEASYRLDDTLQKTIKVNCKDTALNTQWTSTFGVTSDIGATTTITAPKQENRVFDHWVWDGAGSDVDLTQPTLTIDSFSTALSGKITAIYTPVISKIDVGFSAPEVHKVLSSAATYVKIGTGEDALIEVTDYFKDKTDEGVSLSWLPEGDEDGEAEHLTSYTASLPLNLAALPVGVNYKLADAVDVMLNGNTLDSSLAYVADDASGTKTLYISFPETAAYEFKECTMPADVNMAFLDACGFQTEADKGNHPNWDLPDVLPITYKCGETDFADINWETPQNFNKSDLKAQTLTAKGTVNYPSYVDSEGAPTEVVVTINVATPDKVETPKSSVPAGAYDAVQFIDLSSSTQGATIYYTTDGTEPSVDSNEYEGNPIEVSKTTTIKALAVAEGMISSDVASYTYEIASTPDPKPEPEGELVYVTFDSQGGSIVSTACISSGNRCPYPETDPTRTGYKFLGWYTDKACSDGKEFKFDDLGLSLAIITTNTTVYAKWTEDSAKPAPDTPDTPDVPDTPDATDTTEATDATDTANEVNAESASKITDVGEIAQTGDSLADSPILITLLVLCVASLFGLRALLR